MEIVRTELDGVLLIRPRRFEDPRGFLAEVYRRDRLEEAGIRHEFVQDNLSFSVRHVLRGLHAQHPRPQAKLVRAVQGEIFDVAVDARRGSPGFGRWFGATLSGTNLQALFVPEGFLHGFCVLSETAVVEYKCSDYYRPDGQISVRWDDPDLGIAWPVQEPILSPKDRTAPRLAEVAGRLPAFDPGS